MTSPGRLVLSLAALVWATGAAATETRFEALGTETDHLVIKSTTDLWVFRPIIEAFQTSAPEISVTYVELTTNVLNGHLTEACDAGEFFADLVISSSIDQQVKLVNDGCSRPLSAETGSTLPDWAKWRDELFGLTFEPAVIVYNRAFFADRAVPMTRFELIDLLRESDAYEEKIGTYDIETSGVGYLFAFEDAAQAGTWGRLVESFGRNSAQLFCCTSDILERVSDGSLLIGYNVLGSYALARAEQDPRIGIVAPHDYTLVLSRAAMVSRHARTPETAQRFIEFVLSDVGRRLLTAEARLLSPVDGMETLTEIMGDSAVDPQSLRPITMSPALMVGLDQAKRRLFLQQWRDAMSPSSTAEDGADGR